MLIDFITVILGSIEIDTFKVLIKNLINLLFNTNIILFFKQKVN